MFFMSILPPKERDTLKTFCSIFDRFCVIKVIISVGCAFYLLSNRGNRA